MDDADALYILFWRILLHYRRGKAVMRRATIA